jgi:hypothetical protein
MYPQSSRQAVQLANQLSEVEVLTAQLQQIEQFQQQNEKQEAAIESQRQQIIQQLNRAVANSREIANQATQASAPFQNAQSSYSYQPQIPAQWGQPNVAFTNQPNQTIQ